MEVYPKLELVKYYLSSEWSLFSCMCSIVYLVAIVKKASKPYFDKEILQWNF